MEEIEATLNSVKYKSYKSSYIEHTPQGTKSNLIPHETVKFNKQHQNRLKNDLILTITQGFIKTNT